MRTTNFIVNPIRLKRLRAQGYNNESDRSLSDLSIGIRFAYALCTSILIPAVVFHSIPLLTFVLLVAIGSVLLPNHPFDYIYNFGVRQIWGLPKLPPRSAQLKFACSIATVFLSVTIYLFLQGFMTAGYITGSLLISVATLLSTTDICIPSIIYNSIVPEKA